MNVKLGNSWKIDALYAVLVAAILSAVGLLANFPTSTLATAGVVVVALPITFARVSGTPRRKRKNYPDETGSGEAREIF